MKKTIAAITLAAALALQAAPPLLPESKTVIIIDAKKASAIIIYAGQKTIVTNAVDFATLTNSVLPAAAAIAAKP